MSNLKDDDLEELLRIARHALQSERVRRELSILKEDADRLLLVVDGEIKRRISEFNAIQIARLMGDKSSAK